MALKLVPAEAADSIVARLKTIEQCEAIIRATVARYDGLRAFETELVNRGVADKVTALMKKG